MMVRFFILAWLWLGVSAALMWWVQLSVDAMYRTSMETVERAMERIKTAFRPLLRRHQEEAIGLVVGEPLARRSGRDWRPKQLARLPSSGLVRNRVRRAVVASRVSVLAGERCRQALGVLAALVLDRHARTSLRCSAVCPAGKPVAALSGATSGLRGRCS